MASPRGDNKGLVQLLLFLMTSLSDVVVSVPANHRYSGIVADDLHIEYHPSASLVGHGSNPAAVVDGDGATTGLGVYHGSYISDWSSDWSIPAGTVGGRLNVARCVDIPSNMSLCRNIGYDQMRLPNLLDHDTLAETTHQASSWVPLLNIRCHPDTQMFLCSLFAPVCLDRPIYPCQTLCKAVKIGCEARMLKYGFPWPEMLNCDKFPLDNDLCIGSQSDQQQAVQTEDAVCSVCSQPDTFENIVDNFCQSEFVMRIRLSQSSIEGDDIRLTANKRKQLKKTVDKKKLKGHKLQFFIENGAYCQCNGIALSSPTQAPRRNAGVGQATGSGSATPMLNTGSYLVMGSRRSDRLVLSFIQPLDKQSTGQTRAMNAMKQENICKSIIAAGSPNRKQGSRGKGGDGPRKSSDSANLGGKGNKLKPSRQQATAVTVSTTTPVGSTTTTKATTLPTTTTTTVLSTTTRQLSLSGVSTAGNKRKFGGGGTRNSGSRQNIINGKTDQSGGSSAVTGDQRQAVQGTPADHRKAQMGLTDVTTASGQQRQQQRSGGKTKGNAAVNDRSAA